MRTHRGRSVPFRMLRAPVSWCEIPFPPAKSRNRQPAALTSTAQVSTQVSFAAEEGDRLLETGQPWGLKCREHPVGSI